jgi:serine/threonine-protein kinase
MGTDRDPSSSDGGTDDTLAAPAEQAPTSAATPTPAGSSSAPSRDSSPTFSSRYRSGAVIARGGMGEILTARDEQIGRSVAIKRLRAREASQSPELLARFLREARIQGRLEHPAIVPVHELTTSPDGEPFFVMKQLSGTTLADVIASTAKKFTRQQLLRAFVDICLAIEFAHTRGVVHRDLKPANIMLGDFGEVYVLDWGIARVADDPSSNPARESFSDIETLDDSASTATVAGTVLGTPGYMSPEQVRGDADLDGRGDVYALGCILFEILASAPLHPRGQAGMASALAGIDARPSRTVADVPPELDTVCATATQKDRADRFPTARALGDAVQSFLDGDRDLALRKDLAVAELARARDALAKNAQTDALRAAARALALDPQAREPAELVGRLMLEPPKEMPPEVVAELHALDLSAMQAQARRGGVAMLGYVLMLPLMWLAGIHDPFAVGAIAILSLAVFAITRRILRDPSYRIMYAGIILNMVTVGVIAYATTSFLIAPAAAVMTAGMFAMHPRVGSALGLALGFAAATLAPFFAGLLDLAPAHFAIRDGMFLLSPSQGRLEAIPAYLGLTVFIIVGLALGVGLSRGIAIDRDRDQRALQLQSWQLRQLVPRS